MAQALALALPRPALSAPLEALRVLVVCTCGLALAFARMSF